MLGVWTLASCILSKPISISLHFEFFACDMLIHPSKAIDPLVDARL